MLLSFSQAQERARRVRLLILDVDGVLTDGGLYFNSSGEPGQRFDIKDAQGLILAQKAGLAIAVVTGLGLPCTADFMRRIGISDFYPGKSAKLEVVEEILAAKGLTFNELAYLGDDYVDLAPLRRAGLGMCPADAVPEILELAHWVSSKSGGRGAVREAVAFILKAQGKWDRFWRE